MNKEKKYIIFGIVMIVVLLIGFTYAFYQSEMNSNKSKVTIDTDDMRIIFTNGEAIEASDLYAEDNLDIVKTFSVENKTSKEYKYNIVFEDLVNTFKTTGYLVYKITSDDGGYNMTEFADVPKSQSANDYILVYSLPIEGKSIHNYNIEIKYINDEENSQDEDQGAKLSGNIYISQGTTATLAEKMLKDNPTISTRTDFSTTFTENTTGTLFKTNKTEDGSDVYYYAGNTTNNWVKFGKETRASCTYNGKEVTYVNLTSQTIRNVESESECTLTNICQYDAMGPLVGLSEEECGQVKGTWTTDKATYNIASEKDIYWRIVRTNEDKSVRMLYSGISPDTTTGYIGSSTFNENDDDPMYVGYMYGTSGSLENNRTNTNDSTIKTYIDTWYQNNLLNNYDKYLSKTAIYCNDRSVGSRTYSTSSSFDYGAYTRLVTNKAPSYKCGANASNGLFETTQALADKFSASTTGGGNGLLKYPIALMTVDELAFAGGKNEEAFSSPYAWYYTNSQGKSITKGLYWWPLSPGDWSHSTVHVWVVFGSDGPGYLSGLHVQANCEVRPSVSLDSCVTIKSGNGTPTDPYVVDETSCS